MKKNNIILICIIAYLIIPLQGNTQQKENRKVGFTLQKAITYALQHNTKIKNANLSIKAAEKQKWEAIAIGLPQINGKLDYSNALSRPESIASDPLTSFFFPKHKATPSVTLSQLIFDGSYLVGLQASKVFLEISNNAKIKTNKEIIKAVTSIYSNVLLVQESISLFDKNIANLKGSIKESKELFKSGFTEEESVEQLQITLNDLINNLENLKQLESTSVKMLKLIIGYKQDENLIISDDLTSLSNEIDFAQNNVENISVFENIDYKISENNAESKRLLYKLEQSKLLPNLGGFINGNYLGQSTLANNDKFKFFEKDQQWLGFVTAGIQLNIPIFSSFSKTAKIKRAKINWEIAKNDLSNLQTEIDINILNAKTGLNFAYKTLANKKQNLVLAEKIEKKNNIKYKEGIATSFELRQAQTQLYATQQEHLQAMVDVINKQAELNALKN